MNLRGDPDQGMGRVSGKSGVSDCPASTLAEYISSASSKQLPASVTEWATVLVADSLSCMLGALAMPESRLIRAVADAHKGNTTGLSVGYGLTSMNAAVFCNAQLANLLDFDDTHDVFIPYHPGCLIVPAALTVADSVGASGRDFLTAVVVAYEAALRVGRSLGSMLWWGSNLPWTGLAQFGPAIAAAKLYELDASRVRALFSIIALDTRIPALPSGRVKVDIPGDTPRSILKGNFGSIAEAGVAAAVKARAGLSGVPGFLEWSLSDWYRAGLPEVGFDRLTANLGEEYAIMRTSLKPTPSCRWTHTPITAAWNALGSSRLDATRVKRIRILGVPRLERARCSTIMEAQYSMSCALALALSGIEPGPKWYVGGVFKSTPVLDLADKVIQERDLGAELAEMRDGRLTCRLEIELNDGRRIEGECQALKGSPDNPLTSDECRAKFLANTTHLGGCVEDLDSAIRELAQASSVRDLSAILARVEDRL